MNKFFIKNIICCFVLAMSFGASAQNAWIGELKVASLDCEAKSVCYTIDITGNRQDAWSLGDQNYRLFYDAANVSVLSVESLLPEGKYSKAHIRDVLEIVNQGQEDFSPLDNIDKNLGFLNFAVTAYAKDNPEGAVKVARAKTVSVAEVCFSFSDQMLEEGEENALNIYFSRPETAGQITKQYTVISEIDAPLHTKGTKSVAFSDLTYHVGTEAQLGKLCKSKAIQNPTGKNAVSVYPNPIAEGGFLNYNLAETLEGAHDVSIYDLRGRLVEIYEDMPEGDNRIRLNEKYTPGTYFIQVKLDRKVVNASFTVMNP